jgi:hypothetical protein
VVEYVGLVRAAFAVPGELDVATRWRIGGRTVFGFEALV